MSAPLSNSSLSAASSTRLLLPRASLASCVRAYVTRSTMETPLLDRAQRLNRFPATPLCSITWFIEGEAEMIDPLPLPGQTFVRAIFSGPQTRPSVSYNPGPVRAFMLAFYPQAMQALTGLDLPTCVDSWGPLAATLGPQWSDMSDAVLAAPNDAARIAVIENFLEPRWQALRANEPGAAIGDWVRRLGMQAATAGWGRGVRNVERRIKAWAGQPMRTLRRMQRAEKSFLDVRTELEQGRITLAEVAARGGYADQAHFSRETREITGVSPSELIRAEQEDESYWIYRVWA